MDQSFGGGWTETKLSCLGEYLDQYMTLFAANERAQFLNPIYVDAFAGSGSRRSDVPLMSALDDDEWNSYLRGSASVALNMEKPFKEYVFIEKSHSRIRSLAALKDKSTPASSRVHIVQGDANIVLPKWLGTRNWRKDRAVVFLDPYGMDVGWSLIEQIAATRAIDLWYLFPIGIGVERLLTRRQMPPPDFAHSLDQLFGTPTWRQEFYRYEVQPTLFGDEQQQLVKQAGFRNVGQFILRRLKSAFAAVAEEPLLLYNTRGTPLYLFCFAVGNPSAASTAVRIAQGVINKVDRENPSGSKLREGEAEY